MNGWVVVVGWCGEGGGEVGMKELEMSRFLVNLKYIGI